LKVRVGRRRPSKESSCNPQAEQTRNLRRPDIVYIYIITVTIQRLSSFTSETVTIIKSDNIKVDSRIVNSPNSVVRSETS
jgi:hypothetical protein